MDAVAEAPWMGSRRVSDGGDSLSKHKRKTQKRRSNERLSLMLWFA
ncbi:hypothetical protein AOR13_10 [Alteromonas stellipolaris LMG 21856]|nr:hypothetical protein AOR13_10 [Alteromonas stellipolaris LMG 21856]